MVRQRSAQEITNEQVGHFELFRLSLRDIRWWWGGLAATASFGLQAAALVLGSVGAGAGAAGNGAAVRLRAPLPVSGALGEFLEN